LSSAARLTLAWLAVFAVLAACGAGERAPAPVEIRESPSQFTILLQRDPERSFGIDARNRRFVIHEPGLEPFRPRIEAAEALAYHREHGRLSLVLGEGKGVFSWLVDVGTWKRLERFASQRLPGQVPLREE
jgi:hypothetical protein